jgi:fatty acid amide hydrolase 2
MNELLLLSGSALAARIRRREVSSAEVVEAHIRQIERVNPALNAVVRPRFDAAREEAREADRALREGRPDLGPFHGVPCSIKESFAVRGMPNTSGLVAREGRLAEADAVTVARLRRAGSIVLGVTNVSELCMWMESNNRVYGRCNNPYDQARTAGGSSGGEGAIIGAGGTPYGLGADIGGSIRMPAFFNGVFGHKPSGGLVPNAGQHPSASPGLEHFVCTGPLARRAEDLHPLLQVLLHGDERASALKDPATADLRSLNVFFIEDDGRHRVDPELLRAQERAAAALAARGATVKRADLPDFKHAVEIWGSAVGEAGGPTFAELMGEGTPVPAGRELLRWLLGRSPHTFPAVALALLEKLQKAVPAGHTQRFLALRHRLKQQTIDLLGPNGVLLYPPHPLPAPRHIGPLLHPLRWVYTAIFNVLELPVTAVPMGLSREGLPLGVQVASIPGNDHLTIAAALELEREHGGWSPPRRWLA